MLWSFLSQLVRKVRESLASIDDLQPRIRDIVRGSYEEAVETAFYFAIALAGAALFCSFFIKEKPLNRRRRHTYQQGLLTRLYQQQQTTRHRSVTPTQITARNVKARKVQVEISKHSRSEYHVNEHLVSQEEGKTMMERMNDADKF